MANEVELDKKAAKAQKKELKRQRKEAYAHDDDELEEETLGGKIAIVFVTLLIIIIWFAIIALLIKFDVGGFGSTVMRPILKDVPYINKILPEASGEEKEKENSKYPYQTMDEAIAYIKELEAQLAEAQESNSKDDAYVADLEAQVAEWKVYKENEAKFEKTKEKFYEEVIFSDEAPDINEYKEYYESIDPENAEILYQRVLEQQQEDSEIQDYVTAYSEMKPKQAAAIFNTMTDDLKLVARILQAMDADSRGDILGAMDAEIAAKVTKLMEP